ncbi:MAG: MATE family efflux transporter [Hyphomicrobiaceae bacterium]|nr:MATE family efflux transporter [Hyphomicrobiaceae bacterium]MCC0024029.1 MATE family efflux transporter [Hyphomicrobiaceae bacterium]
MSVAAAKSETIDAALVSAGHVTWLGETIELLKLSGPLILAQIAGILLFTTDVVMMGWLGPTYLAAGSLSTSLMHPLSIGGMGVITATSPLIAQAIGARRFRDVRRVARQGLWVSVALSFITIPIILCAKPIFLALNQIPSVVDDAQTYLNIAAFALLPSYGIVVYRSVLQAHGKTGLLLVIAIMGVLLNALMNYGLMFGNFGLPRLELAGAAISTVAVNFVMLAAGLYAVSVHPATRRYHVLTRILKPDWPRFVQIWRVGTPIGLSMLSEVGLFGVAVIMMGWISTEAVAAHAVALQVAAISFMVPLGLSMGTTVRVGLHYGAGNPDGVAKSGWSSMGLTALFMAVTCAAYLTVPQFFVHLFLDPTDPNNASTIALATSYLIVSGLFQFFDGGQVSSTAALRGLSDTRFPMLAALVGYWLFGLGVAYALAFVAGWQGVGIWAGLGAGLGFVAVTLTIRFFLRERLGLLRGLRD